MAKKSIDTEGSGSSAPSLSEIASAFFDANPHYNSLIITDDGVVFENSISGMNSALNYAEAKAPKLNYQIFERK
jgi:hypothetical protein